MNDIADSHFVEQTIAQYQICAIVPVYNAGILVKNVLNDLLQYPIDIIVVNDGSNDGLTLPILQSFGEKIILCSYNKNIGKGHALKVGFKEALQRHYHYALTMDADGQHRVEDVEKFMHEVVLHQKDALLLGSRSFDNENMPSSNRFANNFSNFWYKVQTGKKLSDTQTGFRLYPLQALSKMTIFTSRYETELEILVRLTWRGIDIAEVPVEVYYPPKEERVSYFRPQRDFMRISILNTCFCILSIVYGYPRMLVNRILKK